MKRQCVKLAFPFDVLAKWEYQLKHCGDEDLDKIVAAANRWFRCTAEGDITKAAWRKIKAGSKAEKVAFILGGDPIVADGGLLHFLSEQDVKGLVRAPKQS